MNETDKQSCAEVIALAVEFIEHYVPLRKQEAASEISDLINAAFRAGSEIAMDECKRGLDRMANAGSN